MQHPLRRDRRGDARPHQAARAPRPRAILIQCAGGGNAVRDRSTSSGSLHGFDPFGGTGPLVLLYHATAVAEPTGWRRSGARAVPDAIDCASDRTSARSLDGIAPVGRLHPDENRPWRSRRIGCSSSRRCCSLLLLASVLAFDLRAGRPSGKRCRLRGARAGPVRNYPALAPRGDPERSEIAQSTPLSYRFGEISGLGNRGRGAP
jgi:hypothetical protein